MRDRGRSAVYAAEDQIARLLERGGEVDFYGSKLQVPLQRHFGNLESVEAYLDALRDLTWGYGDTPRPRIVPSRSEHSAKWQAPNTIRVPDSSRWAMTEMVILHEYAHHVTHHVASHSRSGFESRGWTGTGPEVSSGTGIEKMAGHGREFRQVFLDLVSNAIGAEARLLLTAALDQTGVGAGNQTDS